MSKPESDPFTLLPPAPLQDASTAPPPGVSSSSTSAPSPGGSMDTKWKSAPSPDEETGEEKLIASHSVSIDISTPIVAPEQEKHLATGHFVSLADVDASEVELETPDDPMIGEVIGNFKIIEVIGSGGFGTVYRAEHQLLGESFAVKVLKLGTQTDKEFIKRFQREARVLAQLKHDNIVHLADFGLLPDGGLYIIMEYLKGASLQERLREKEPFPIPRMRALVAQLCQVLHYIQKRKVVHRDIKPGNIFLVQDEMGRERVKLIDFGIAALDEEHNEPLTKTEAFLGTAKYASPEQIIGEGELDHRSDLYSFTVILYRLIAGRLPFRGKGVMNIINMQLNSPPPTLSSLYPGRRWSPKLEAFLQKALAKSPHQRPQNALLYQEMCDIALVEQMEIDRMHEQAQTGIFSRAKIKAQSDAYQDPSSSHPSLSQPSAISWMDASQSSGPRRAGADLFSDSHSHSVSKSQVKPGSEPLDLGADLSSDSLLSDAEGEVASFPKTPSLAPRSVDSNQLSTRVSAIDSQQVPAQPAIGPSFWVRFVLFSLVGLLLGFGALYGLREFVLVEQQGTKPGQRKVPSVDQLQAGKKPVKAPVRPRIVRPVPPRPALVPDAGPLERPAPRVPEKRTKAPKPRTRRLSRRERLRRKRLREKRRRAWLAARRKRARERARRRAAKAGPCGAAPANMRWVIGRMVKPTSGRPRILISGCSSCQIKRKSGKICLALPKRRVQLSVLLGGYFSCIHSIPSSSTHVEWRLKEEELGINLGGCASVK